MNLKHFSFWADKAVSHVGSALFTEQADDTAWNDSVWFPVDYIQKPIDENVQLFIE